MNLQDRVVWVTGSGKRLGRAMALDLARRGAHIVVHYNHSEDEAVEVAEQVRDLGRKSIVVKGDLSKINDIRIIMAQIEDAFRRLDVLVNSASNFIRVPLADITEQIWDESIDVNLKGPTFCALEAAKLMRRGGGGKIINFADWAGFRPYRHYLPYMISKGGVITMTRALALELAPDIMVNAVAPGPVLLPEGTTPEEEAQIIRNVPLKKTGTPDDIVATVAFLIEGSDYITGQVICVDGGRYIASV